MRLKSPKGEGVHPSQSGTLRSAAAPDPSTIATLSLVGLLRRANGDFCLRECWREECVPASARRLL